MTTDGASTSASDPSHAQPDDLALMQRISQSDRSAFSDFYDRYSSLVYTVCLRVLHKREEAEDVMIDVFRELWERSDRYHPSRASPRTYLMTVTRSRAIDRFRKLGSRPKPSVDTDQLGNVVNGKTSPSRGQGGPAGAVILREQQTQLQAVMEELDPLQRQAIELAYYEGLSHSEIAQKLESPLGTVKTRIRQGIIRLRDRLNTAIGETDKA